MANDCGVTWREKYYNMVTIDGGIVVLEISCVCVCVCVCVRACVCVCVPFVQSKKAILT